MFLSILFSTKLNYLNVPLLQSKFCPGFADSALQNRSVYTSNDCPLHNWTISSCRDSPADSCGDTLDPAKENDCIGLSGIWFTLLSPQHAHLNNAIADVILIVTNIY